MVIHCHVGSNDHCVYGNYCIFCFDFNHKYFGACTHAAIYLMYLCIATQGVLQQREYYKPAKLVSGRYSFRFPA